MKKYKSRNKKPPKWDYYGKSNYKKKESFDDMMASFMEQSGENQKALKNRLDKKKKKGKKVNGKVSE